MKVTKIEPSANLSFKDYFKKDQQKKKEQQKKKAVEQSKEKTDSHFIGWA